MNHFKRDRGAAAFYLVMTLFAALLSLLPLCLTACPHRDPAVPADVMVPPVVDAAPGLDAAPVDDCEADCRLWRAQGCPEGNPTAAGTTCEQVCRNAAAVDIDTAHQLSCAQAAANCGAHRVCPY